MSVPQRTTVLRRWALAAGLVCAGPGFAASIHSGPLPAIGGIGDRLECTVANVDDKPIEEIRVRIRNVDFGTVVSDVSCAGTPPGGACPSTFHVPGPALPSRFACSVDAKAKKDSLRGTFLRTSSTGQSDDLVVELR
ncbi:MAG: hypothetical protein U1F51_14395 [Burkholderiales bacterium]